jgi:uncharacterized membrane protein
MLTRRLALWSFVAFCVLCACALLRVHFWSYGADSGTFSQAILDAFGGMHNGVEHTTHFRFHWSPALVLLWPFLALARGDWVLQIILAAATVACAPLLAAIAAPRLGVALAERCGLVALLYPPLVGVGFGEFRDLGLLPVLALGWWLALQCRSWIWLAICAVLLAGLREDVCLELALIGSVVAVFALRRGDRPMAVAAGLSAALGVASGAIYVFLVLPRLGPWEPSHFYTYPFANGPGALLLAPVLHPLALLAAIATWGRMTYLLEAFAPLAFIPYRSRLLWLAFPGFAIVLLAKDPSVWRMGMHYAALWIPWTLIAFVAGVATLRQPARWLSAVLAICAIVLIAFNPLHPLHYLRPSYHALDDARAALACVPAGASLATHDEWYSTVAAVRPEAMVVGESRSLAAKYLVFASDYPNAEFQAKVLPRIARLAHDGKLRVVCRRGNVFAYVRLGV